MLALTNTKFSVRFLAVGGAALLTAGWILLSHPASQPAPLPVGVLDPPAAVDVLVFVSGAVQSPGLYRVAPGARVSDAIALAGGMTSAADPGHLPNMAAKVKDGQQINVALAKSSASRTIKLDINVASLDELTQIPGMPQGLPEGIIQYREEWGRFVSLNELKSVLGVDATTETELAKYLKIVA